MQRHVLVPLLSDLSIAKALRSPLPHEALMYDFDHLDEKGPGARGRIENPNKVLLRSYAIRKDGARVASNKIAPGHRVSETVLDPELGAEKFIDRTHDERDNRPWRIE